MSYRLMIAGFVLAALALGSSGPAHGMPLDPRLTDPDNPGMTLRGEPIIPKPAWVDRPPPIPAGGRRGTQQILIICIQFSDQAASQSTTSFGNMVFGPWSPYSVNDYYLEVSYAGLSLTGSSMGWYTAQHPRSYYGAGQNGFGSYPNNAASLVAEAMAAADSAGVDFSQYDNDGDGTAESIFIVHSGEGYETSLDGNDIQSHYSTLSGMGDPSAPYTYDGKLVDPYLCVPELHASSPVTHAKIGVYCHEYGHMLGLPDLYDVGRWCTGITSHGVGVYCLMAYGGWGGDVITPERPTHMCAWSKMQLGWLSPTVVQIPITGYTLSAIETMPTVLKVGMDTRPTEYFLLSFRDNTQSLDQTLPGTGLCIWHVDEEIASENDCEDGGTCTSSSHYMLALEQPDGNFDLDCGASSNYGDAGDVYPYGGASSFTGATIPSSDTYSGNASGVSVTNIALGSGVLTMDLTPGVLCQYLAYDDGTCELGMSWGVPGYGFAVRVTPTAYTFWLKGIYVFSQDLYYPDFQYQIWDDSGSGGTPGSPLSPVRTTSGAAGLSWNYLDLTADSISVSSGDLWILYLEYNYSKIGVDTNPPNNMRSMYYYYGGFYPDTDHWGNYMIRALGDPRTGTAVEEELAEATLPVRLTSGYPNPFSSHTTLRLSLARAGQVSARIYDARGRLVRCLLDGPVEAPARDLVWDGQDDAGRSLPSGIYFCRLRAAGEERTRKVVLVR